jgi:Mn2+/Fe2+ NRAMP family transporter
LNQCRWSLYSHKGHPETRLCAALAILRYNYLFVEYVRSLSKCQVIRYSVEVAAVFGLLNADCFKEERFLAVLVGILGATISPCRFFWQVAVEGEEERGKGRALSQRKGATAGELRFARTDTITGMFFSNLIMYFIILTTAATLHAHGQTDITTARQAAEALRPLAGNGA